MKNSFYKKIRRLCDEDHLYYWFIAVGQMSDGHLAYCKCDEFEEVFDYDEQYIQIRECGSLLMVRI